jgi:hypothetical protein
MKKKKIIFKHIGDAEYHCERYISQYPCLILVYYTKIQKNYNSFSKWYIITKANINKSYIVLILILDLNNLRRQTTNIITKLNVFMCFLRQNIRKTSTTPQISNKHCTAHTPHQ